MSEVSLAEVRALVDTDLGDTDLQAVIDRAEARLALAIGPLTGDRTQVFFITGGQSHDRLTLQRTTDEVAVTDNGVAVDEDDIRILSDGRTLLRYGAGGAYDGGYWAGPVEVTYEPNDLALVTDVVISMVANRVMGLSTAGGVLGDIVSETTGSYSYTRGRTAASTQTSEQRERAIIATLLPKQLPMSVRLRSATSGRRFLLGTVRP